MKKAIAISLLVILVISLSLVGAWDHYGRGSTETHIQHSPIEITIHPNNQGKLFEVINPAKAQVPTLKTTAPSKTPKPTPPNVVKAEVPSNATKPANPPVKTGKHDPSIEQRLKASNSGQVGPLGSSGNAAGVRVLIYIDPDYFRDKKFKAAMAEIKGVLQGKGVKVIRASANPIVAVIPNENALNAIENVPWVSYIRDAELPLAVTLAGNTMSEGVYNISAPYAWNKGYDGRGVKVGILDIPDGGFSNYQDLINQGELPSNTYLYTPNGAGSGVHGSACAEIVYDVAPGIDGLYLAVYDTTEEMYNATKWFINNGVRVISHSISTFSWGPSQFDTNEDGTPEFWDVYRIINNTIENGVVWVNAAGNGRMTHWEGDWRDTDNDGILDIYGTPSAPGIEPDREAIQVILNSSVSKTFTAWIRWSDYPYPSSGPTNDFNAYLLCWNGTGWETVAYSENVQDGTFGQEPLEIVSFDLSSKGWDDGDVHYCRLVVRKYNAPNADQMHFDIWWEGPAGYWYYSDATYNPIVEEGSVIPPADHPDVLTVGAVPWTNVTTPEWLSSEGPAYNPYLGSNTWLKPNVVAPDGVSTVSYGSFYGTSPSAPHAAGVAALVLSSKSDLGSQDVFYILQHTAKDINATGPDYLTGYGLINASDATPQRIWWLYPTPQNGAIVDVQDVTFNLSTWYKKLSESNITLDGTGSSMTGDSSQKVWTSTATGLPEGLHKYNATTLDIFDIWRVQTSTKYFYVNLGTKNAADGIDGDDASGPGRTWANDKTVPPDSSSVVNGTFVWKDASDAYTSPCTGNTYNITEIQLRADSQYIYVLVKFADTLAIGTNPAPIVEIGFDTNNNGSIDYWAYAFLNKPGVSSGQAEFLDVYDASWNNVATKDPTDTVFVARNNVVEMQIPKTIIGNPSGTIGLSASVYEGLGADTICKGSDAMTDGGNTLTTVDLTSVPFFSSEIVVALIVLGLIAYFRKL